MRLLERKTPAWDRLIPKTAGSQSAHATKASARLDISGGDFVLPGHARDTADASRLECVEPSLLSGRNAEIVPTERSLTMLNNSTSVLCSSTID